MRSRKEASRLGLGNCRVTGAFTKGINTPASRVRPGPSTRATAVRQYENRGTSGPPRVNLDKSVVQKLQAH